MSERAAAGSGTMVRLVLLTRPGCHLCDDMKAAAAEAGRVRPLAVEEVDISTDRGLERRFAMEIPVLMRGEQVVARARTTPAALLDALRDSDDEPA